MVRFALQVGSIALVTVLGIALVGCTSPPPSIDGTAWKLSSWSADGAADQFETTLEFKDAEVGGRAPVNSFGGSYKATDGRLELGEMRRTLMAGSPEQDAAETTFFELLDRVERYDTDGERLTLLDAAGEELLVFETAR